MWPTEPQRPRLDTWGSAILSMCRCVVETFTQAPLHGCWRQTARIRRAMGFDLVRGGAEWPGWLDRAVRQDRVRRSRAMTLIIDGEATVLGNTSVCRTSTRCGASLQSRAPTAHLSRVRSTLSRRLRSAPLTECKRALKDGWRKRRQRSLFGTVRERRWRDGLPPLLQAQIGRDSTVRQLGALRRTSPALSDKPLGSQSNGT
jgi:hypothetical protein